MHFPWQAQYKRPAVRRSGRWFPEKGCILEHQIFRFAEMILRDKCSTSYDLASLFCAWPAGSAPAALASLLFDPPEPQIIGKTQCFATFLPFRAPGSSFFWDFLFLIFFSSLLFSDSSHLCLSIVHIVGSLTSKLLSTSTSLHIRADYVTYAVCNSPWMHHMCMSIHPCSWGMAMCVNR